MKQLFAMMMVWLLSPCCQQEKTISIPVYFENNSDVDASVTVNAYINGTLYQALPVTRNAQTIYDAFLQIPIRVHDKKNIKLMFVIAAQHDTAACSITPKQLKMINHVHVNVYKTLLKKGFDCAGTVLQKDSVVDQGFYCEVLLKHP